MVLESQEWRLQKEITYRKAHNYTIKQNSRNILYMTSLKRRGCDCENFGARITEFRVVVRKICLKEVLG
jgi:hypothetical protein